MRYSKVGWLFIAREEEICKKKIKNITIFFFYKYQIKYILKFFKNIFNLIFIKKFKFA